MAKDSSKKLTRFQSAATVVSAELLNRLYGGEYGFNDVVDPKDSLVSGHVHDGLHADGHAQKVELTQGAHITGQLPHANLGGSNGTTPAVQKKNVQPYSEGIYGTPGVNHNLAIPEYEEIDGDKKYYLDLSAVRGDIFSVGGQPGWIQGGVTDFDVAVTSAGLVLTLNGTWIANTKIGKFNFVNATVNLNTPSTIAAGSYYVYMDGATAVLSVSSTLPDITTVGDIPIGRFTHNGVNITNQIDLRFFVKDDNRKILYTVRGDGTAGDANAEGCFMSIEAALAWAAAYGTTGVSSKTEIHLRGTVFVNSTINLQLSYLTIHGEGDAELVSGASVNPMINLNGRSAIAFHDINFRCEHPNSVAIADSSASLFDLMIHRCIFNGGTEWVRAINLTSTVVTQFQIHECRVKASTRGVNILNPRGCNISRVDITTNTPDPSSIGLCLGTPGSPASYFGTKIDQVYTTNFVTGFYLGTSATSVTEAYVNNAQFGLVIGVGCQDLKVSNSFINCQNETNSVGIRIVGSDAAANQNVKGIILNSNTILNCEDYGISISGHVKDSAIKGNRIDLYAGDATPPTAIGISLESTSDGFPSNFGIVDNLIRRAKAGIITNGSSDIRSSATFTVAQYLNLTAGVDNITIGGSTLTAVAGAPGANQFQIGGSNNATANNIAQAINLSTNDFFDFIARADVSGNIVTVYAVEHGPQGNLAVTTSDATAITVSGANMTGGQNRNITNVIISDNNITNCGNGTTGNATPGTVAGLGGFGIATKFSRNMIVANNLISEIGIILEDDETPFLPGANVYSRGIIVWNSSKISVDDNNIRDLAIDGAGTSEGIFVLCLNTSVEPRFAFYQQDISMQSNTITWSPQGNFAQVNSVPGRYGIGSLVDGSVENASSELIMRSFIVNSNTIRNAVLAGIISAAFSSKSFMSNFNIESNKVSPFQSNFNTLGAGIYTTSFDTDIVDFIVSNNILRIEDNYDGSNYPYINMGGIAFQTYNIGTASLIENIIVSDNTIYSRGPAILFDSNSEVNKCNISNNSIYMKEAGTDDNDVCRGIVIEMGSLGSKASSIREINISGNSISGGDGCRISSKFGTNIKEVSIIGNTFDGTDNDTNPADLTNPQFDGFYAALSLHCQESGTPGAGAVFDGIVINGNTFRDSKREAIAITKGITSAARATSDIIVSGNTFESCGSASSSALDIPAVVLVGAIGNTSDPVNNIAISNNSFNDCSARNNDDQGALVVNIASIINILSVGTAYIENCSVTHNRFKTTVVGANTTAIPTLLSTASGVISVISYTTLRNVDISKNMIDDLVCAVLADACSGIGSAILSLSISGSENISVNENQINNAAVSCSVTDQDSWSAILLPMSLGSLDSLNVNENIVTNSGTVNIHTDPAATSYGGLILSTADALETASISGNNANDINIVKDNTDTANRVGAIFINNVTSTGRLNISNNNFSNAPDTTYDGTGILILSAAIFDSIITGNHLVVPASQVGNGLHIEATAAGQTIISNNVVSNYYYPVYINSGAASGFTISGNSLLGDEGAIKFDGGDVFFEFFTISGNSIYSSNYGFRVAVKFKNVSISGNSFSCLQGMYFTRDFAGSDITGNTFETTTNAIELAGADFSESTIIGNVVSSGLGSGIILPGTVIGSISNNRIYVNGYPIEISGSSNYLSISGNSLTSASDHALVISGSASYLTINGNTSESITSNKYGYVISDSLQNSSITGNSIYTDLRGIDFTGTATFAYNAISSNTIKAANVASIGMRFTSRTLSHISIVGNDVQAVSAATAGTASSPATGTCSGNTGTTTSGANSWDSWAYNSGTNRVLIYVGGGNASAEAIVAIAGIVGAGAIITINGVALTSVSANRTSGSNNFDGRTSATAARNDMIAAINDPVNGFYNFCFSYASAVGTGVTIRLRAPGRAGNLITAVETADPAAVLTVTTFSGGTDNPLNS